MDLQPGWECSQCSKTFKTNKDLTRHMVTHDPDAQVKCEFCGKISKNRLALSSHMTRHQSNRKRPRCDTCHRMFCDLPTLRRHNDTVHSTKNRPRFPCTFPGCEKTYLSKDYIPQHVKIDHAQNPVRFPCTLCGNEFKTRVELEQHISTHTTEKPYKCATCGRSFSIKGNMKKHEKTHLQKSTRDVSQCHLCPQTFLGKDGLPRHFRVVHENRKNFPCGLCDKRFPNSYDLKRHVVAKHVTNKERIHACDKCEYKSHSKANLASHRKHHSPARHGCYFCGKKFFVFHELVKHFRVHTLEQLK